LKKHAIKNQKSLIYICDGLLKTGKFSALDIYDVGTRFFCDRLFSN
jgi:hypothetical protein